MLLEKPIEENGYLHQNKSRRFLSERCTGREKSKIIDDIRQFIETFLYITNNPVKAGIVKKPQDYEFNGITFFLNANDELFRPP